MFTEAAAPRRNVEIKARLLDLRAARALARQLATEPVQHERQTDTYFACANGRLKLRERAPAPAQLIHYHRPDVQRPKQSDYRLIEIDRPAELRETLAAACGVVVVVEKVREIYLHHNVRIHLDAVPGLGTFLEFEAVLQPAQALSFGEAQVAELCRFFEPVLGEFIEGSYRELLLQAKANSQGS